MISITFVVAHFGREIKGWRAFFKINFDKCVLIATQKI